jgi:glycosyltransferase involved in cell wall biosynthesis
MPRFSVVTPVNVWNEYREKAIKRAARSLKKQTFQDFEHIIVNDGSSRDVKLPKYPQLKVLNKGHAERVIALSAGFRKAKGEIFCTLDSDDEYAPNYLERVDYFFKTWPEYKMFNFESWYKHADGGNWVRGAFKPKKKKVGHQTFGGGQIVSGTYVWHRSIYDDLGGYPSDEINDIDCTPINYGGVRKLCMWTPYDFSAAAQMEFPEIRKFFMVDHVNEPNKIIKELGNPWGQDYYLFYKYTRKYHSKPIDEPLYIVHPKTGVE